MTRTDAHEQHYQDNVQRVLGGEVIDGAPDPAPGQGRLDTHPAVSPEPAGPAGGGPAADPVAPTVDVAADPVPDLAALVESVTTMDWLHVTRRFDCSVEDAMGNPLILMVVAAWMHGRSEHPGMDYWQNQTPSWLKDYLQLPDLDDVVDPMGEATKSEP